jgi:hypothetical protein
MISEKFEGLAQYYIIHFSRPFFTLADTYSMYVGSR